MINPLFQLCSLSPLWYLSLKAIHNTVKKKKKKKLLFNLVSMLITPKAFITVSRLWINSEQLL